MSPARLLEHFDRLIDTPDAVPRLRRFILDLAVRGKLVEQDPKDEPAGQLLKRIGKEKSRLSKAGTIRTPKPRSPMTEEEMPFGIPKSWRWVRLGEVGAIVGGGTPPSKDASCFTEGGNGIAWLTPTDLGKHVGLYVAHGARDLTENGLSSASAQLMPAGSVLFTSRAPIGYTAIAANVITTNQGFKSVVPFLMESNRYIAVYFTAFATWINGKASGTTFKEVSGKIVGNLPFPLPPIAEQHRVVAKVAELMALCDELEAAQTKREKRRDRLVAATLHGLNNGDATPTPGAPSTFKESARFYFNHLPRLTTRPEHIHQLRQTILNLAVRGKLVAQDPHEAPSHAPIQRALERRATLVRINRVRHKKHDDLPDLTDPPNLPASWTFERLGNLVDPEHTISYGVLVPGNDVPDGVPFVRAQDLSLSDHPERPNKAISPDIEKAYARTRLRGGEILLCVVGSIGKLGIAPPSWAGANIARAVARISPIDEILRDYLLIVLRGQPVQTYFTETTRTLAQPTLNVGLIEQTPIPIPPLNEQHRIVAKVDELMAFCDELESRLTATAATRLQTVESVLQEALAGIRSVLA